MSTKKNEKIFSFFTKRLIMLQTHIGFSYKCVNSEKWKLTTNSRIFTNQDFSNFVRKKVLHRH